MALVKLAQRLLALKFWGQKGWAMLEKDPANESSTESATSKSVRPRWASKPVPRRVAKRREFDKSQVDVEAIKVLAVLMALTIGMVLILRALGV